MDSMMMGVPKTWEFFDKLKFNAQELLINDWGKFKSMEDGAKAAYLFGELSKEVGTDEFK